MATQTEACPLTPVKKSPVENQRAARAHPAELSQLHHGEEDPLASQDPPLLHTLIPGQFLRPPAGPADDSSSRHVDGRPSF